MNSLSDDCDELELLLVDSTAVEDELRCSVELDDTLDRLLCDELLSLELDELLEFVQIVELDDEVKLTAVELDDALEVVSASDVDDSLISVELDDNDESLLLSLLKVELLELVRLATVEDDDDSELALVRLTIVDELDELCVDNSVELELLDSPDDWDELDSLLVTSDEAVLSLLGDDALVFAAGSSLDVDISVELDELDSPYLVDVWIPGPSDNPGEQAFKKYRVIRQSNGELIAVFRIVAPISVITPALSFTSTRSFSENVPLIVLTPKWCNALRMRYTLPDAVCRFFVKSISPLMLEIERVRLDASVSSKPSFFTLAVKLPKPG